MRAASLGRKGQRRRRFGGSIRHKRRPPPTIFSPAAKPAMLASVQSRFNVRAEARSARRLPCGGLCQADAKAMGAMDLARPFLEIGQESVGDLWAWAVAGRPG